MEVVVLLCSYSTTVSCGSCGIRTSRVCVAVKLGLVVQMVQECSLLVGLHPDQATEPILQLAKRFQKPFCILPCCVFPLQHPGRKVIRQDGSHAPVLNYDDLVLYISQAGRARTAALAFAGRNIAVYRVTGTEQATCGMQNFSCA